MVPTPKQIIETAKELHDAYRAAFKALDGVVTRKSRLIGRTYTEKRKTLHDHGFLSCTHHGKVYFLRRAVYVLKQRHAVRPPF